MSGKYFWDEQHFLRVRGDPEPVRVPDGEVCNRLNLYPHLVSTGEALRLENQKLKSLLKEARKIVKASSRRAGHSDWLERTKDLA